MISRYPSLYLTSGAEFTSRPEVGRGNADQGSLAVDNAAHLVSFSSLGFSMTRLSVCLVVSSLGHGADCICSPTQGILFLHLVVLGPVIGLYKEVLTPRCTMWIAGLALCDHGLASPCSCSDINGLQTADERLQKLCMTLPIVPSLAVNLGPGYEVCASTLGERVRYTSQLGVSQSHTSPWRLEHSIMHSLEKAAHLQTSDIAQRSILRHTGPWPGRRITDQGVRLIQNHKRS